MSSEGGGPCLVQAKELAKSKETAAAAASKLFAGNEDEGFLTLGPVGV